MVMALLMPVLLLSGIFIGVSVLQKRQGPSWLAGLPRPGSPYSTRA